jgi:hypothetical protein
LVQLRLYSANCLDLALWKTVITEDGIGGGGGGGTGRLTDKPDPALERTGDDTREPPSR